MEVWKVVLRLWALLSLLSLAIAGACFWLDLNGRTAQLLDSYLDTYHLSHVSLFLFGASAPFVLAIVMPILGVFLTFIRWSMGIDAPRPDVRPRREPRAAAIAPVPRAAARRNPAA